MSKVAMRLPDYLAAVESGSLPPLDAELVRRAASMIHNGSTSAVGASSTVPAVGVGEAPFGEPEPSGAVPSPGAHTSTPKRRRAASTVGASAHQSSESDEPGRTNARAV